MPISCRIVFDILRTLPPGEHPVRELAHMARLSPAQVWRALRRLEGARLIRRTSPGRGRRGASWQVLWRTYPQRCVSPRPIGCTQNPGRRELSHPDRPVKRPAKALAWGMAQVRRELSRWPIPWPRRRELLAACGVALRRALGRPPPGGWTVRAWGSLVRRLIGHLQRAELPRGRAVYARVGALVQELLYELLAHRQSAGRIGMEVTYAAD